LDPLVGVDIVTVDGAYLLVIGCGEMKLEGEAEGRIVREE
jgi:hypothetical protein